MTLLPSYEVFGCLHDGAVHTRQQQASEKRRGTKSQGARQDGGSNLTAGYGDLKGAPVAASARHIGASGCFGRPWSRNGRATTARKPPARLVQTAGVQQFEPAKTKLVEFGRFAQRHAAKRGRKRPETIYFLG